MIWATVSSWFCFCWLYRASPSLTAKNIIKLIGIDHLVMSMCRVFFSVVGRGCLLCFAWQNSVSLCPPSFCTPRANLPVTPGISWLSIFAFQSPIMKRTSYPYLSESRQNENHNHRKVTKLITWTTALAQWNYEPCHVGPRKDGRVMVESSDKTWSTGEGNGKPLQYSCLENPMNSMKRQKGVTLKDELPRSVHAQYTTGDQWRNNSRENEETAPKQSNTLLWMW